MTRKTNTKEASKVILSNEQVADIIDEIRGTPGNLDMTVTSVAKTDRSNVDDKFLEEIDDAIFRCDICDWWCGRDEESEAPRVCQECFDPGVEGEAEEDFDEDEEDEDIEFEEDEESVEF